MGKWLVRYETILIILAAVILIRTPTLLEPYWYGDEGVYLTIGQAMHRGEELYLGIHDNKPPFIYLVAAAVNGDQFWFRFVAMASNVVVVGIFWLLAKQWLGKDHQALWATLIFVAVTNLPMWEGNIANAENFFLLFTVGAFYWLYRGRSALIGGLLLGLGGLFKIPALVEVGVWPVYWLVTGQKKWLEQSALVVIGALLPLGVSILYYFSRGSLPNYLIAAGLQNVPYLSSWGGPVSFKVRAGLAGILGLGLVVGRKLINHKTWLLAMWWLVVLFAALLSGRPYPHYLLQLAAPLALGLVALLASREKERLLLTGLAVLTFISWSTFKFYTYPVKKYYVNFLTWVVGGESQKEYFNNFSGDTWRNYQIAKLINAGTMPDEKVFIWGDQPMIYALARRQPVGKYTVRYHILDFRAQAATIVLLQAEPPRVIVSFGAEKDLPGLSGIIAHSYRLQTEVGGARVFRRINPANAKKL